MTKNLKEYLESIVAIPERRQVWVIEREDAVKILEWHEKADAMLRFRKAAEDLGEYAADLNDKLEAINTYAKRCIQEDIPIAPILVRILGLLGTE